MAEKQPVGVQFQEIVLTAAQFTSQNPVLLKGQLGIESDTKLVKYGNEVNAWTARPYLQGGCPVGGILFYTGSVLPSGFLWCEGQAVSRATYPNLFSAIGTTWGAGNGSTTFNLPATFARAMQPQGTAGTVVAEHTHTHWTDFKCAAGAYDENPRSICYNAIGANGLGYAYALQCVSENQSIVQGRRQHGMQTRGTTSGAEVQYPKVNVCVIIKY